MSLPLHLIQFQHPTLRIWRWKLKDRYTIVIVTHNMQQAARISDKTAFFLLGEIIEYNDTTELFSRPQNKKTEEYITGRFG